MFLLLGIHTGNFVTSHGLAINCSTDLRWFERIVPCGILGRTVTSLSKELNKCINVDDTVPAFLESFSDAFKCSLVSKSTIADAIGHVADN